MFLLPFLVMLHCQLVMRSLLVMLLLLGDVVIAMIVTRMRTAMKSGCGRACASSWSCSSSRTAIKTLVNARSGRHLCRTCESDWRHKAMLPEWGSPPNQPSGPSQWLGGGANEGGASERRGGANT